MMWHTVALAGQARFLVLIPFVMISPLLSLPIPLHI
jgi:hypothetical protein